MRHLPRVCFLFLLILFFNSCDYKDVETDAKTYCSCKDREYMNETTPGECAKLLLSMKKKYEYLPEQQELLVLKIADCMIEE